jgi:urease accessory protein
MPTITTIHTAMHTEQPTNLALLRLMQLISPSLPIGSFTYSQGIEWAVESGWIQKADDLSAWLHDQLHSTLQDLDVPILQRCYQAIQQSDEIALTYWIDYLNASRETRELLLEEQQRGRALTDLLLALAIPPVQQYQALLRHNQIAAFAAAASHWQIPLHDAAYGYTWSWLENLVLAAVKIIPLGQTQGQRLLYELSPLIPDIVQTGLQLEDDAIGASNPALAIASSRHETQYTRLFRS